ncbi:TELO2-interacting protein 1 homolog isoform X1 [Lates japonicus]|uniref:TELO2-interacting protein 1 homolog isoform X1 n=1 Tax=Lates japonicus TaxID=270547 RepID=A0AAD3M1I5_LATJO|nr:TELO2-interacting protein 1 homolog isoform X1 [Lates japonicus]
MRLERQPSLQLRESLNVCWEGWRESAREIGRGDERVERSQVDRGSRSWQGYERYSQGTGEKRIKAAISAVSLSSLGVREGEADLDAVCEACLPYLSCRQPIRLQEACLSVFRHLIQVDPDTLWFTLNELHCPSSYIPPHPDLQPVQLSGMGRPRDEYSDNVLKLLKEEFGSLASTVNQPVS